MGRYLGKLWILAQTKTGLSVIGAFLAALGVAAIVWLPPWFAEMEAAPLSRLPRVWSARVDIYRQTVIQVLGGIVVAFGLGVALHRSRAAMRAAAATEYGNTIERFTQAINHLGQLNTRDGSPHVVVRLGGIYSLEQIAKQAPEEYHRQVMEILTAYVRESAAIENPEIEAIKLFANAHGFGQGEPPPTLESLLAYVAEKIEVSVEVLREFVDYRRALAEGKMGLDLVSLNQIRKALSSSVGKITPSEDVQAALTVIGRRDDNLDPPWIRLNLTRTNLRGVVFRLGNFRNVNFAGSVLDNSVWEASTLYGADLSRVSFRNSWLVGTDLQQATLQGAELEGCRLDHAKLNGARLEKANCPNANFVGASLSEATLTDGNFMQASLSQSDLTNAQCIRTGFERAHLGGSNLSSADLSNSSLHNADLRKANLMGADFYRANLMFADITGADFSGAHLSGANLQNVKGWNRNQLCSAEFDESIVLPDGSTGVSKEQWCKAQMETDKMANE